MDLPQLEPGTSYCARVRVKTIPEYKGLWSEWSNECTWTTDWGMSLGHSPAVQGKGGSRATLPYVHPWGVALGTLHTL